MENDYKIFKFLLTEFSKDNFWSILSLMGVSLGINLINTYGISNMVAKLYDATEKGTTTAIWTTFYWLAFFYIIYQALYYVFYDIEKNIVYTMKMWLRYKLMDLVMMVNNNIYSDVNFANLTSPIHRIADLIGYIVSNVSGYLLPNVILLVIVSFYFFTINPILSAVFFASNLVIIFIFKSIFGKLIDENMNYENKNIDTDSAMVDMLNNMDKIVYRGKTRDESKRMYHLATQSSDYAIQYYDLTNKYSSAISMFILAVFLGCVVYLLHLLIKKKISQVQFVTSLTILTLYREKLAVVTEDIPEFAGYVGRMNVTFSYFDHISKNLDAILEKQQKQKSDANIKLQFQNIRFENVAYKYSTGKYVFSEKSLNFDVKNQTIVGITGPSGSGKSTLMKLLIGMYPPDKGEIYIDGVNINDIDPDYIRRYVTYVNQNSKLFDAKVIQNMMYGCMDPEKCNIYLQKIMKYPRISKLYNNMDINTKDAGLLGENLSGGQRQIVNMISGFINPSEILILDEPTNALDPALKKEVIQMIHDFKKYKKCIFIVSHDKDVFEIFDDEIKM